MNKGQRHIKIRDLISNREIETQDELVELLKSAGYEVTQATQNTRPLGCVFLIRSFSHKDAGISPE